MGFQRLSQDVVGVVVIQDHDRFVASTGCNGETARLVGGNFTSDGVDDGGEDLVGSRAGFFLKVLECIARGKWSLEWIGGNKVGFGGPDVLAVLVHVAFGCGF